MRREHTTRRSLYYEKKNVMCRRQISLSAMRLHAGIRLIAGVVLGLVGFANMFFALFPKPTWDILLGAWPTDIHHGVQKLIVVIGFFLVMLSYGLMRGKRQAWCITLLLLIVSAILRVLSGGFVITTIMITALVILLFTLSRAFRAKSDPPSLWRGYLALLTGLGIVTLYTLGGFVVLYQQFETFFDRFGFEDVLFRLLTNAHSLHLAPSTQAFVFGHALPMLCLSAVFYGVALILRPVAAVLLPNEQERQQAARITRRYGTNSISYFALGQEKSYFFSSSGMAFISYVLEGNVAVVAGDPIGSEEEVRLVIQKFIAFCYEQGWTTVFWQVRDALVETYCQHGLHVMKIGEDAIIFTRTFTLAGKAMANVRTSAKRAEKEGMRIVFSHGRVQDAEHLAQMGQISRAWLANKGGTEKGFSMGHFAVHSNDELIYALAVDDAGEVQAFATFVPIYGRQGWGLDLMRRVEQNPPGTMELLLTRSIEYVKERGAGMVSLGLAPLSNINQTDETLLESSIDFLTHRFGDPSKNQSLCNFKKKFQPCWESRYLVFSHTLTLPKAGWALYHAHQRDASLLVALYHMLRAWRERHQRAGKGIADLAHDTGRSVPGGVSI